MNRAQSKRLRQLRLRDRETKLVFSNEPNRIQTLSKFGEQMSKPRRRWSNPEIYDPLAEYRGINQGLPPKGAGD